MSIRMQKRWWIGAALLSAGALTAAYFMDFDKGHKRRERFVRRMSYACNTARARAWHAVSHEPPRPAEGRVLLDRVESELFADRSIPHGRLTMDVEGKTVVLRGQLDNAEQMHHVERLVADIPGVTRVRSLLHLPGTPAPNKAAALAASAEVVRTGGWPDEAPPDVDSES